MHADNKTTACIGLFNLSTHRYLFFCFSLDNAENRQTIDIALPLLRSGKYIVFGSNAFSSMSGNAEETANKKTRSTLLDGNHVFPAFYACYLLRSKASANSNRTYVSL